MSDISNKLRNVKTRERVARAARNMTTKLRTYFTKKTAPNKDEINTEPLYAFEDTRPPYGAQEIGRIYD